MAACGFVSMAVILLGVWVIAGFVPPPSPRLSLNEIANIYAQRQGPIRVGLIVSLFGSGNAFAAIVSTMLFGAVFGLVWALAGYAATRGQRDFTSISQVVATRYEVLVEHKFAQQGRDLLAQMEGPAPGVTGTVL